MIIHDEGDPAPSAADALQVDALTISEHHLSAPQSDGSMVDQVPP